MRKALERSKFAGHRKMKQIRISPKVASINFPEHITVPENSHSTGWSGYQNTIRAEHDLTAMR